MRLKIHNFQVYKKVKFGAEFFFFFAILFEPENILSMFLKFCGIRLQTEFSFSVSCNKKLWSCYCEVIYTAFLISPYMVLSSPKSFSVAGQSNKTLQLLL